MKLVRSSPVLFVADFFHPGGGLAVELLLNRNMGHGRGCRRPMPVFLTRRDPDDVPLPDFLDRTAPLLNPAGASRHNEYLAKRMAVPCRPGVRLKRDEGARCA